MGVLNPLTETINSVTSAATGIWDDAFGFFGGKPTLQATSMPPPPPLNYGPYTAPMMPQRQQDVNIEGRIEVSAAKG